MSVLKQKRTTSKAEFINTANQIYVETINFLTRLSARYSRLVAEPIAKLAGEVIDHAEKGNSIFPSRRKLKLFHREFIEGKREFTDIEQYMECQSAYYRNFNDHGRLLRLRRLYHAIFFGGAKCLELSKTGPNLA